MGQGHLVGRAEDALGLPGSLVGAGAVGTPPVESPVAAVPVPRRQKAGVEGRSVPEYADRLSHDGSERTGYVPAARVSASVLWVRGDRAMMNSPALTPYSTVRISRDSVYPPVRSTIQPRNSGDSIMPAL